MTPLLIGLVGRKRSGKDAFGDFLVKNYGFEKHGMSDGVRDVLLAINPWIGPWVRFRDYVNEVGYEKSKELKEVRRLLQALGTEGVRDNIGENTWIDLAIKRTNEVRAAGTPVVISGIRFPNEAKAVHVAGGWLVRIERPSLQSNDLHSSETAMELFKPDIWVMNEGTLEELEANSTEVIRQLTRPVRVTAL